MKTTSPRTADANYCPLQRSRKWLLCIFTYSILLCVVTRTITASGFNLALEHFQQDPWQRFTQVYAIAFSVMVVTTAR